MVQSLVQLIIVLISCSHAFQLNRSPQCRKLKFAPKDDYMYPYQPDDDFGITSHQSSSSPSSSRQQYDPVKQKSLVWIIDDEESILDAVGTYLTSSGYQVQSFLNATFPQHLLQKEEGHPDAIISDVMMPEISGIDFLREIRSNPSPMIHNLPFILLTAKGMTEDRIRGYDAGTDAYLMKPFDPEELVAMLDQMIQRKDLFSADESLSVDELRKDLFEVRTLIEEKGNLLSESSNNDVDRSSNNSIISEIEMEILVLLCEGYMNKEIASELQYSTSRVEKHLTSMFRKTGCNNRTELVRWAVANEYVDL